MSQHGSVVIASGATNSASIVAQGDYTYLMVMYGDFTGATYTVDISPDQGTTWFVMDQPEDGGGMTPPESRASLIRIGGARTIRITSVGAEASARTVYYILS